MISIDVGNGQAVNLDSATVESVTKGRRKGTAQIHIGTITIEVEEAPASLIKRIRADGGDPAVPETKRKGSKEGAGEAEEEAEGEGAGDGPAGDLGDPGETPPPWDAEDDSLST